MNPQFRHLHLGQAAVDESFCSRYETAVVGGQEYDGLGDLLGAPSLPTGMPLDSIVVTKIFRTCSWSGDP
jgi:hypothetical protein